MKLDSAVLYTTDINQALSFYRDLLGLPIVRMQEGKFVAFLLDGGVKLSVKKAAEDREKPGAQTIFLAVPDLESWFEKLKDKAKVQKPLTAESWGKEFSVLDADGNKVQFVEEG